MLAPKTLIDNDISRFGYPKCAASLALVNDDIATKQRRLLYFSIKYAIMDK